MRAAAVTLAMLSSACAGEPAGEDASRSTQADSVAPQFYALTADCSDGQVCFWAIDTAGEVGSVDLYLQETADVADPWSEHHWLFTDVGGGRFAINLDLVGDAGGYADNVTTRFDMERDADRVSWLVFVKDRGDAVADCATGGADPSWWEATCP